MIAITSDGDAVDLGRRIADREARLATLSDHPLSEDEKRAVAYAAALHPVGSDTYRGYRDGWLMGYASPARHSVLGEELHSREYWEAYWRGFDAGRAARRLEWQVQS